jgi:transcriptional regulator GlxA family with amidase domain
MAGSRAVPRATCRGLAPWQVELALGLLLNDLCADQSVEQVAAHCGLSRSYFEKAFKLSLGAPPHRWLVRQRIQRAADMLEQTSDSIGLIALICGFSDQSHLTRVFHALAGSSPAAWRRQRKAGVASTLVAGQFLPAPVSSGEIAPIGRGGANGSSMKSPPGKSGMDAPP